MPADEVRVLARVRLHQRDELGDVLRRKRRVRKEQRRKSGRERDRGEVLRHLVRQLGVKGRRDAVGAVVADEERVAVGRLAGDEFARHRAARAGAVFDDHLLAEALGEFRREDPPERVGVAARCVRNDELHRARGERLRRGAERDAGGT
ncbi:MAG: hypothetical protein RML56_10745 [Burkholderiales bacterium]|nr:hypothetical protein [Burkholderiales bacterium]